MVKVTERPVQAPIYEEVVHDRAAMLISAMGGAVVIFLSCSNLMQAIHQKIYSIGDIAFLVVFMVLSLLMPVFLYFGRHPLRIIVTEQAIQLQSGTIFPAHNQNIPFSAIVAIRRSSYRPRAYGRPSDRPVQSVGLAQVWKMGGKQVLEIVLQDSKRVIILSSRNDQLAALLHEMTRIPIEDWREKTS